MAVGIVLGPISAFLVFLSMTKVHQIWFPYALAPTLHAARISMAYQANARRSPSPLSWATYIAGYLIMCWGGTSLTHEALSIPSPMLYSFDPYINYITVHLVLTLVFYFFPAALHPPTLDTILFPLDSFIRTLSITNTLSVLSRPRDDIYPINPLLPSSPLTHLILGGLASSGGGLLAATFSTWSSNWSFSVPPLLRRDASLWSTLDTWGGALIAVVYGLATQHHAFSGLENWLVHWTGLDSRYAPQIIWSIKGGRPQTEFPPLTPLEAQALSVAVLGLLFGLRVWKVHWSGKDKLESKIKRDLQKGKTKTQ